MRLHEFLQSQQDAIIDRWKADVLRTSAPLAVSSLELVDHMPQFLREVIAALREAAGLAPINVVTDARVTAAEHGAQRLRLGFSLDAVVREYGALRDAMVASALASGAEISFAELQVIFNCVIPGIAGAVSEYALQRDAELARQANEHFAFVAHELRNPLSSAMMAFHLLKEREQLPSGARTMLALERGLERSIELIDKTLQIARMASGVELNREWTTLAQIFEDVEMSAASEAQSKEIGLRVVLDEPAARLHIDVRLVRSALGNLLRNAVKYTSAGGHVELHGRLSGGHALIEISDTCGGMPPEKIEAAFAPFVRLNQKESGYGLGLAIAKQAVEAHGGTIRVQNAPGKGCTFSVELPLQHAAA